MTIVLLTGDLVVLSRVDGVAARSGAKPLSAATAEQAATLCATNAADLLIVDLTTPSLDMARLVTAAKAGATAAPKIIAFGPHVHAAKLAAAREAGCDAVVSRGEFFSQLETFLRH